MNEVQFKEKFLRESKLFKAWGNYVTNIIIEGVSKLHNVTYFFKVAPEPRVKEVNSLISKAFYRGKNYQDPYNDITDKVGTRFVVLLGEHIEMLKGIIEHCGIWDYSLDRDFQKEREEKPTLFEYQSMHYIVRNRVSINYEGEEIEASTPCEIQIRTLLQHAYSELTHDTIYKPVNYVPRNIYRLVARSMALIENTDELFSRVNEMICMEYEEKTLFIKELSRLYSEYNVPQYDEKLSTFIYDSIKNILEEGDLLSLDHYLKGSHGLANIINRKYDSNLIYRQPIILLLFYLVEFRQHQLLENWPLPEYYLSPVFSDLGYSLPH